MEAQHSALVKGRSGAVYEAKLDEIVALRRELAAGLAAQGAGENQVKEPKGKARRITDAIASVRAALLSGKLTPVENNAILSAVVMAVNPNEEKTEVSLALRPFAVEIDLETGTQILICNMNIDLKRTPAEA